MGRHFSKVGATVILGPSNKKSQVAQPPPPPAPSSDALVSGRDSRSDHPEGDITDGRAIRGWNQSVCLYSLQYRLYSLSKLRVGADLFCSDLP